MAEEQWLLRRSLLSTLEAFAAAQPKDLSGDPDMFHCADCHAGEETGWAKDHSVTLSPVFHNRLWIVTSHFLVRHISQFGHQTSTSVKGLDVSLDILSLEFEACPSSTLDYLSGFGGLLNTD